MCISFIFFLLHFDKKFFHFFGFIFLVVCTTSVFLCTADEPNRTKTTEIDERREKGKTHNFIKQDTHLYEEETQVFCNIKKKEKFFFFHQRETRIINEKRTSNSI